jgi:nucleotide-binding universal stress UspA family protein
MSGVTSSHAPAVWDRVVCAVDLTPASVRAACEVAQLMPPAAELILCAIFNPDGDPEAHVLRGGTRDVRAAIDRVHRQVQDVHDCELHLREGPPVQRLMAELTATRATMVAIGSHRGSDDVGIMLGHVVTAMLEQAACSVLIAHDGPPLGAASGDGVIVGFDGSGGARRALAVGTELAARLSLDLRAILATGGRDAPSPAAVFEELPRRGLAVDEDPRTPVEALVGASRSARVLILGSRHLSGAMALSSVSEQVTALASCPVLVVH